VNSMSLWIHFAGGNARLEGFTYLWDTPTSGTRPMRLLAYIDFFYWRNRLISLIDPLLLPLPTPSMPKKAAQSINPLEPPELSLEERTKLAHKR